MNTQFTAGILESGRTLSNIGNSAGVTAGIAACLPGPPYGRAFLACSLLFWFVEAWLAIRVAIDAKLFRSMSDEASLDTFLVDFGLIRKARHRNLENRIRGALRLWRVAVAALALQLSALAIGIILRIENL